MVCVVGVSPVLFWRNTLRQNSLLAKKYSNDVELTLMNNRDLQFAVYKSAFRGMSGDPAYKSLKKPQDLYKLPSENTEVKKEKKLPEEYDPKRAIAAYNKTKDKEQWLQMKN